MDREALGRLVSGASRLYARRDVWVSDLASTTGLSEAGVRLGFEHLEREVSDDDVARLSAWALSQGPADRVTVLLSATVFVAAFRALVLARIVAPEVVLRPSRRDPICARALVECMQDTSIRIEEGLDVASVDRGVIHAYGTDATLRAVEAAARVPVLGHGTGLGVCVVGGDPVAAGEAIARDVVAFDQRGCLSPRIVWVDGGARARDVAHALASALEASPVPRGVLSVDERGEARRWGESMRFAGQVWEGPWGAVGLTCAPDAVLGPPGRHVHVAPFATTPELRAALAPLARFVTTIGFQDGGLDPAALVPHARVVALGSMQRPPLDGPVDRRSAGVSSTDPRRCPAPTAR